MTNNQIPFLEATNVCKRFPGVRALHNVSLSVFPGESVAVIGENGAGKSTLMKILAGIQTADQGTLQVQGHEVVIKNVNDALRHGIALIHQELNLCDNLAVAANVYLGREPKRLGLIDHAQLNRDARKYLTEVGLDIDPRTLLADLSIGQQQLVEIAKALSCDAKLLIMDEPTSSLSSREVERLFKVIHILRAKGVSILYISHRLSEVKKVCDRVVALRDGENSGGLDSDQISHDEMVRLMVGRQLDQFYSHIPHRPSDVVLEAVDLKTNAHPSQAINFQLRKGEIIGLAGLVGAGRTELLETLFGIRRAVAGEIRIDGTPVRVRSPRTAIRHGVCLIPEDRKQQGLVLAMSVRHNTSLPGLKNVSWNYLISPFREYRLANEMVQRMNVRTPGVQQIIQYLSGGNQQKVVIAKWLALGPKVLLLDEPTRGIDVGAKHEIYELMESLAKQGVAVLFVSSEMEEVLGMADRLLVMHEGALAGTLKREDFSEEAIMQLATGNTKIPVA